jgi:hypothetical protein
MITLIVSTGWMIFPRLPAVFFKSFFVSYSFVLLVNFGVLLKANNAKKALFRLEEKKIRFRFASFRFEFRQ